jgi:hypothetical protein
MFILQVREKDIVKQKDSLIWLHAYSISCQRLSGESGERS